MKSKSILLAALAFLISCETSNIGSIESKEDVSFFISQDNKCTKGTPIDSAQGISNIGVFATLTQGLYADAATLEPNFMLNQLVEHKDDKWVYIPPRRWSYDPNEFISFFAYAPYASKENGITIVEESGKMPTIRYHVPRKNTIMQPDLMVAVPAYDRVKSQGAVGLTFRHALAAISFSVKGDPSRVITDVKLRNIVPEATLSMDGSHVVWSDPEERQTRSYQLGLIGGVTAPAYGDISTSITADDGYFMMIPQDITDVEIEVTVDGENELIDLNFKPNSKWVAGAKYDYIVDLDTETINYNISQTSNCYIVNNTGVTDVYIPVDQRINAFWHDYSGLCEADAVKYMINCNTEWDAEVVWYDNDDLYTEGVTTVERYEGSIPKDCSTSKSYVCDGTEAVMKVTLPDNSAIGNILVAVTKNINGEKKVLWSWHLWVTDYNPDSTVHTASAIKKYEVKGGKIHRYTKDSDYWTEGLYANTFAMDRDIGSHNNQSKDGLFYQWGRKDPFSTISKWSVVEELATFSAAVQNPNTFYATIYGWCNEPSDNFYEKNNYLWYDIAILNNDENVFKKSLFDPSPLGWCVPVSAAYKEWLWRNDYSGIVYFEMSGHILPTDGSLSHTFPTNVNRENEPEITSFWFSDKSSDDEACFHYVETQSISVSNICTAYGHRIRPVKIPN